MVGRDRCSASLHVARRQAVDFGGSLHMTSFMSDTGFGRPIGLVDGPEPHPSRWTRCPAEAVSTATLTGDLDAQTAVAARAVFDRVPSDAREVRIDLRSVDLLSAAGVTEVVRLLRRLRDDTEVVVRARPLARRTLTAVGLGPLVNGVTVGCLRAALSRQHV